jgi:6-phospho-beta-glucosidase
MNKIKIAIIGAGSSYTPEIIERLAEMRQALPVSELGLMDIDPQRLETVAGFCRRFLGHLQYDIPLKTTTERAEAIRGADFIIVQLRVGGNAQRVLDEKIPLKYGIIGQETTGPGGMFKALRTIPVMLDIARQVEQLNPQAWIINYANPTGINAEAVQKYTRARFIGLCSGGSFPRQAVVQALGASPESVTYNYFGLNHLNFAYNVCIHGKPLSDAEFDRVAQSMTWGSVSADLIRMLRLLPSPYLQYYFHRSRCVAQARTKDHTRGEVVQQLEHEVFAAYADQAQVTKPEALSKRGGGGYSELALGVIEAIAKHQPRELIVNTANQGAVPALPPDAVLEMPCLVDARGATPLTQPPPPAAIWGLIAAVKNYEQLVVEAAVSGGRRLALAALLAHPLVSDYDVAVPLLEEMFAANRDYLPQFNGGGHT